MRLEAVQHELASLTLESEPEKLSQRAKKACSLSSTVTATSFASNTSESLSGSLTELNVICSNQGFS